MIEGSGRCVLAGQALHRTPTPQRGQPVNDANRTDEFVQLFTAHARWLFSYILMLVHNKADAEEVFQETNTTLWQKFNEFTPGTNFRQWATKVAHYKILHYRERQKRSPLLFDDASLEAIHDAVNAMANNFDDLHWALEKCRKKLSELDSELLDLRYEPGATTQGVADALNRSPRSVYRNLERVHQQLYDCIREEMSKEDRP